MNFAILSCCEEKTLDVTDSREEVLNEGCSQLKRTTPETRRLRSWTSTSHPRSNNLSKKYVNGSRGELSNAIS